MRYKGYVGIAKPDVEAGILRGHVVNIADTITFQGATVEELVREFHESVDDYLEFCDSRGESPNKPFSGRIPLRVSPVVHRALTAGARLQDRSLNAFLGSQLAKLARRIDAKLSERETTPKPPAAKGPPKTKARKSARAEAEKPRKAMKG